MRREDRSSISSFLSQTSVGKSLTGLHHASPFILVLGATGHAFGRPADARLTQSGAPVSSA